jgi:hypothetical protein
MQAFPQSDTPDPSGSFERVFITLRYTWTAPEFEGEGITGYQAWLDKAPAPENPTGSLQEIGVTTSDVLRKLFEESNTNFTLYFQVSWVFMNVLAVYVGILCVLYNMYVCMCVCVACMWLGL